MADSTDQQPTIVFVFVVYRVYEGLDRFLRSQGHCSGGSRVVVVDNSEIEYRNDERLANWVHRFGVEVLADGINRGYAGAAQHACDSLPGLADADFFCLANTDLSFQISAVVNELSVIDLAPTVGVLAPRLSGPDGRHIRQRHYVRRPDAATYMRLAKIYDRYWLGVAHRLMADAKRSTRSRRLPALSETLFAPHGAFMIFTRRFVEAPRPFDFPPFLFCEETFVGLSCESRGLECVYLPQVSYSHESHGSMGRKPSRTIVKHLSEAHRLASQALVND